METICDSVSFTINTIQEVLFSFSVINKSVLESTGIVVGKNGQVLVKVNNTGTADIECKLSISVGADTIDRDPEYGMPWKNISGGGSYTFEGLYMKNMPSTPTGVKVEVCARPKGLI